MHLSEPLSDAVAGDAVASRVWGLQSRSLQLLPGELEVRWVLLDDVFGEYVLTTIRQHCCRQYTTLLGSKWSLGRELVAWCFLVDCLE